MSERWTALSVFWTALFGVATASVGQVPVTEPSHHWILIADSDSVDWPLSTMPPADSLASVLEVVLRDFQNMGFLDARIDTVRVSEGAQRSTIAVERGLRYEVGEILVDGVTLFDARAVALDFDTRQGAPLDARVLEQDLDRLLERYDRRGHVAATVHLREITLRNGENRGLVDLALFVDEGPVPELKEIRIPGARRTKRSYVGRVSRMRLGEPLGRFDPDQIQRGLVDSNVFESVGEPALFLESDGAVLVIPIEERAPGSFDAILGYLPASGGRTKGSVIGNVDISLRHLLGAGRRFAFRFNRLPARVTRILIEGEDPYVAGLPLRFFGGFQGYQKDSTFTRQQWRVEGGYRILDGVEAFATLSREATRPGTDSLVNVPRSNTWFAGVGFRVQRIDRPRNPRSGWRLVVNIERGVKVRSLASIVSDGTASRTDEALGQERMMFDWRSFIPVRRRQVIVLGAESSLLMSDVYDASDLFRIGGANSLRGYNEEQFEGHIVGRGLAEWRYLLDRSSFIFVFLDMGLVAQPSSDAILTAYADDNAGRRDWSSYPGYGFGLQFGSEAGLFTVSLALNPDEGLGTRVHVGISLGL